MGDATAGQFDPDTQRDLGEHGAQPGVGWGRIGFRRLGQAGEPREAGRRIAAAEQVDLHLSQKIERRPAAPPRPFLSPLIRTGAFL
jgi:hypothetical protein